MDTITYKTKVFCQTNRNGSRIEGEIQFDVPEGCTQEELESIRDTEIFGWMCEQMEYGPVGELQKVE